MKDPSDETLARRSAVGDVKAFAELVRRHERQLVALVRNQIHDPDHAEDVLQETLLDAWVGVRRLRRPASVRAWLLQVARNRCRDFYRSSQRREKATEDRALKRMMNRFGRVLGQQREAAAVVVEALDEVPGAEREAARMFYLEGLTIAEISARSLCPEGTIKRRLYHARDHLRETFGVGQKGNGAEMSTRKAGSRRQPFPVRQPEIAIARSRGKSFAVDFKELPWWFGVPAVGNHTLWAIYDPPEWKPASVTEMQGVCPAEIHGVECVEININE